MINLIRSERVTPTETHWEVEINGKIVQFAKWVDSDWMVETEMFKGEDLLNDEEYDEVSQFIDEQII